MRVEINTLITKGIPLVIFLFGDLCWKFFTLIFWLDGCSGAGGDPYHRICNEQLVPAWLALGTPLFLDLVLLIILLLILTLPPIRTLKPEFREIVMVIAILSYAAWAFISAFVIWRLPFFDAPYLGAG